MAKSESSPIELPENINRLISSIKSLCGEIKPNRTYIPIDALYYLIDGDKTGWDLYKISVEDGFFFYLVHAATGTIIDLVEDVDHLVDYSQGHKTKSLTPGIPCKLAQDLINEIRKPQENHQEQQDEEDESENWPEVEVSVSENEIFKNATQRE